eukprot:313513-Pelagomonas_calceolata.AAC.1
MALKQVRMSAPSCKAKRLEQLVLYQLMGYRGNIAGGGMAWRWTRSRSLCPAVTEDTCEVVELWVTVNLQLI